MRLHDRIESGGEGDGLVALLMGMRALLDEVVRAAESPRRPTESGRRPIATQPKALAPDDPIVLATLGAMRLATVLDRWFGVALAAGERETSIGDVEERAGVARSGRDAESLLR